MWWEKIKKKTRDYTDPHCSNKPCYSYGNYNLNKFYCINRKLDNWQLSGLSSVLKQLLFNKLLNNRWSFLGRDKVHLTLYSTETVSYLKHEWKFKK